MKKIIILLLALAAYVTTKADVTTQTAAGTYTWVCPVGTTSVTVECWGGGGAGGSAYRSSATPTLRTGGGAGGSYSKKTFTNLVPGNSYTYVVGAGGAATSASGSITHNAIGATANGSNTTFNGTDVVAIGGQGGKDAYDVAIHTVGGSASALGTNAGDLSYLGGNGANAGDGTTGVVGSGGGGGSAGASGAGLTGGTLYVTNGSYYGPIAGTAGAGGGAAGGTGTTTTTQTPGAGATPGAGGAGINNRGAWAAGTAMKVGGAGGVGKIIITSTASLITFADLTVGKTYGDADFTKTATSSSAGAITYGSGSTDVATVDATSGLVHIVNSGTAIITANQAADGGNPAGSASYTLTVLPVITVGALSNGGIVSVEYNSGGTPASNPISFSLTGGGLQSDISIAHNANIEISTDNITYTAVTPLKITPTSGAVNTTVYLRLKAGLAIGALTGGSLPITLTATSAATKNNNLTAAYVWQDALTLMDASTLNFGLSGASASAPDSIQVGGNYLGSNATALVLTPGSNIEISSKRATGFASTPLSFTPSASKVVTTQTIYVRMKGGLAGGTYNDATTKVTATITGETFGTRELQFVGNVLGAPVATAATNLTGNSAIANWAAVAGATGYTVTVTDLTNSLPFGPFTVSDGATTSAFLSLASLSQYTYTVQATENGISSVASNVVAFELNPTTALNSSKMGKVYVSNGQLVVEGASAYSVFNAQGIEVAKATKATDRVALRSGIYFVKVGSKTEKVIVK